MNLAAIYIVNHDYLFDEDKPQTINFGGEYFYSFKEDNNDIYITREKNRNYIKGFFNLVKTTSKLTNLNAIVGENGAGKSTILDIIRNGCNGYGQEATLCQSLLLVESNESGLPYILHNDFNTIFIRDNINDEPILLEHLDENKKPQTIYYSPSYDYRLNSDANYSDDHDISFEKIIEEDLDNFQRKENSSLQRELLFKNSLRHIEFLSSKLVAEKRIFKDLFELPNHNESSLYFSGYTIKRRGEQIQLTNTPTALIPPFEAVSDIIERESSSIRNQLDFISTIDYDKYRMKQSVLSYLLSIIYEQMEKLGSFWDEGYFPYEIKAPSNQSSYTAFIHFIENSYIKVNDSKYPIFNSTLFKSFIDTLYSYIDNNKNAEALSEELLIIPKGDAIKVLTLQRSLLNDLNLYYHKHPPFNTRSTVPDRHKVDGIINYRPFKKRLSTGENALLNLFSRLYDFLNSKLKTIISRVPKNHYIILLDEADLGFHLSWKKKYVKTLLMTLPHFFDELENKPTIQIIFTTHDPLTLSDLPNSNVIYIERNDYDSKSNILNYDTPNRPSKTFGANISDLIADSFFIGDSLIGNFAFDKIRDVIEWLNKKEEKRDSKRYEQIIKLIDEPIVRRKLSEMYDDKMQSDFQLKIIDAQIKKLKALKNTLKNNATPKSK